MTNRPQVGTWFEHKIEKTRIRVVGFSTIHYKLMACEIILSRRNVPPIYFFLFDDEFLEIWGEVGRDE